MTSGSAGASAAGAWTPRPVRASWPGAAPWTICCEEAYRLPMASPAPASRARIAEALRELRLEE